MGYSIDALTQDCYEGTTCLRNKFNIKDENILAQVEADITLAKASQLEEKPLSGNFDFEHYKSIHKFLFEDLYGWAGEIRKINIAKKGTSFADSSEIEKLADRCFERLKKENFFCCMSFDDFIENIVDFYCTTNMLHPFREGNGRTQRAFISQLIRHCGYEINFFDIDPNDIMIATIQSANGVNDFLKEIFRDNITSKDLVL